MVLLLACFYSIPTLGSVIMKQLCKYSRCDIKKDIEHLKELVKNPEFICHKCAIVSNDKKRLCKPEKL